MYVEQHVYLKAISKENKIQVLKYKNPIGIYFFFQGKFCKNGLIADCVRMIQSQTVLFTDVLFQFKLATCTFVQSGINQK